MEAEYARQEASHAPTADLDAIPSALAQPG